MRTIRDYSALLTDIKTRIRAAQVRAALGANAEMLTMYWDVGRMIEQRQKTEGWGAAVIPRLARDIRNELPEVKGFSERNIGYMIRFAREYADTLILQRPVAKLPASGIGQRPVAQLGPTDILPQAVAKTGGILPVLRQIAARLPWGHHVTRMEKVKDLPTRYWYMLTIVEQGWSRDVLAAMIKSRAHDRQGKAVSDHAKGQEGRKRQKPDVSFVLLVPSPELAA